MKQAVDSRVEPYTRGFERVLLSLAALLPAVGAWYLHYFEIGARVFHGPRIHELAIGISVLASGFVAYVAIRCFASSGEVFLRWLALALVAETVIYAPHGLFTPLAHDHTALFLIYGPASRFGMAILLMVGLMRYSVPAVPIEARSRRFWWRGAVALVSFDVVLGMVALLYSAAMPVLRLIFEYGALLITLIAIVLMLMRPKASPLMRIYTFALTGFATASIVFIFARPWTHLWWYAHAVFAAAFMLLGFGVLRAFHTTGSFSGVFSQEELMRRLRSEKERAEVAARELMRANQRLEQLAATDSLTGVANRRRLIAGAQRECERARCGRTPLALLLIDIDHFKAVNDRYGHAAGDAVLKRFAEEGVAVLREIDLMGRIGGEEFAVVLPGADSDEALHVAQRLRAAASAMVVRDVADPEFRVTVSVGVAVLGADGTDPQSLLRAADHRLYLAKGAGRDRVVGVNCRLQTG